LAIVVRNPTCVAVHLGIPDIDGNKRRVSS
jgi:hypothetical protein